MNLFAAEYIFAYHPVIISADVKHNPTTTMSQQISRPKCLLDIGGRIPIGVFNRSEPSGERRFAAGIADDIAFDRFFSNLNESSSNIPFKKESLHFVNFQTVID